jgi:hypothetical protein
MDRLSYEGLNTKGRVIARSEIDDPNFMKASEHILSLSPSTIVFYRARLLRYIAC